MHEEKTFIPEFMESVLFNTFILPYTLNKKDSDDKIGRNGLLNYFVRLCSREIVCDKAGIRSTLPDRDWSIRAAF